MCTRTKNYGDEYVTLLASGVSRFKTDTACSNCRVKVFPERTAGARGFPRGLKRSGYQGSGAEQVSGAVGQGTAPWANPLYHPLCCVVDKIRVGVGG